ncbi:MAG: 23S rRNA (adenine(2030)-N(6))-methyltransferase RlmJ, partial [Pseudomonadota bacterium]
MNYRHAFHAGNHADVLKHLVLLLVLRKLVEKDKPFVALDLFAGQGLYDLLLDERVARTGEWRSGLGRIVGREDAGPGAAPEAVETYRRAVRAFQNGALEDALRWCPGSPALIRDALRGSDRLVAVERHPEEAEALRRYLRDDARARVAEDDGWLAVKALTPPTPRRGVALIDPPFEKTGEFDRMLQALGDGLRRWATGIYLLWHPVKDLRAVAAYE